MASTSTRHRAARWSRTLGALVATAALITAVWTITSARAGSTPKLVAGRGIWIAGHTDFVGYYLADVGGRRVKVYCVSPHRRAPRTVTLRTVSRVPGTSLTITRELAETLAAHGNARTAIEAEAVSQALNTEVGNARAVARRARFLPERARRLAGRYVAEARRMYGPYRLTLRLPTSPLPGRSGIGAVTLRASGGAVPGLVRLRHTGNVVTPRTVRVTTKGTARFTYRTVGGGAVHIAASARVIPTTLRMSRTGRATQLMLTWSPPAIQHAFGSYQGSGPGIGHRYVCSSECAGKPSVTLTACAPANRYPSRVTFWLGRQAHRIGFPTAAHRACASWQVNVPDGTPVSATWQYRTPKGWTRPLPASGAFVVDCPAVPPVAVSLSYDCTDATLSAVLGRQRDGALTPLHNTTDHPMLLVLRGAVTDRVVLEPGATASVQSYPISCGIQSVVTVHAEVQRSAGGNNVGPPVEVRLP